MQVILLLHIHNLILFSVQVTSLFILVPVY